MVAWIRLRARQLLLSIFILVFPHLDHYVVSFLNSWISELQCRGSCASLRAAAFNHFYREKQTPAEQANEYYY